MDSNSRYVCKFSDEMEFIFVNILFQVMYKEGSGYDSKGKEGWKGWIGGLGKMRSVSVGPQVRKI